MILLKYVNNYIYLYVYMEKCTYICNLKKMIFKIAKNTERNTIEAITNRPSTQVVIAVTAKKIEPNVDMNKVKIADLL